MVAAPVAQAAPKKRKSRSSKSKKEKVVSDPKKTMKLFAEAKNAAELIKKHAVADIAVTQKEDKKPAAGPAKK